MNKYDFYYVSLSDGDASLRIRSISASSTYFPSEFNKFNSNQIITFSTLRFIIDGHGTLNGHSFHSGQAFYIDSKITNTFSPEHEIKYFDFGFDGIHYKKLISDININSDEPATPIDIYNFKKLVNLYNELSDMYPSDAPIDPPQILSQIAAKNYFYQALHCLENKNIIHLDTSRRKLLVSVEEYMRNHFSEELNIEKIADFFSIDRRYLHKLFKKYSGISPKQYLSNIRISRATELLSTSELSITEIAEAVGYKDPLQFSTFFKKQTGMSPKQYRELH